MATVIDSFSGQYRFLSNFYPVEIVFNGEVYPSVEHAFQAAKTVDPWKRKQFRLIKSPAMAKRMGRQLDLRADWESIKLSVMDELIETKFDTPDLCDKLLATGNAQLIEGNYWHDNFWGACVCNSCRHMRRQNNLGIILMDHRKRLSDEK